VPNRARLNLGRRGGVLESVGDQLGAHVMGDGPADDLPGVAVDDGGQIDESLPGAEVGDVADELAPGEVGREIGVDSAVSVGTVGLLEEVLYSGDQGLAAVRGRGLRPGGPVVKAGCRHGQPEPHFHH
jgi:hypothetical protein